MNKTIVYLLDSGRWEMITLMDRFDRVFRGIANLLPRKIVYFAVIRAGAHATSGRYSEQEVPALSFITMLERWEKSND